jgi:hypothetical protein
MSRRVLGAAHPLTVAVADSLETTQSNRAEQPTRRGGKPAARRTECAAVAPRSATALAEAEAKARVAEAELLAMLELEDEGAASRGSAKGKPKGKAKGK